MPAAPASGIVYGGAVRAVEFGSTGVLAPSDSPLGRVSTSLPPGPPQATYTKHHLHVNVGATLREFLLEGFLVAGELGGRSVVRPTPPRLGARCRGGADGCGDRESGSMHRARGT